jgi:hypothetical protein
MRKRQSLRSTRKLTIVAQDPAFRSGGRILRADVDVPAEALLPGPCGYRVNVIDYDATANVLYSQAKLGSGLDEDNDLFADAPDAELLGSPTFHAQNVYAIAMRVLSRFEFALGRRVPWGCAGHQLHIAPHAFAEPNAFYSREDRALFFGYFSGALDGAPILTCLSHDVVAHETTHALLDGLRPGFLEPSSPDQAAFHEALGDVVALLSVFSLKPVLDALLADESDNQLVPVERLTLNALVQSALFGLAEQMGQEVAGVRGKALRRSVELPPGRNYLADPAFAEEHMRGELIVAAIMRSFLKVWLRRLERVGTIREGFKDKSLVIEEGSSAADHLLTMAIRAIDYCPPIELSFSDYLSALLTVDSEVVPDDRYGYRDALLAGFRDYGIRPSKNAGKDGSWLRCAREMVHSRTHFDSMLRDREEVFRFVWENRENLQISTLGYIEVQSVRPSVRISPEGFVLKETIAEYLETLTLNAGELRKLEVEVPEELRDWSRVTLLGGGTIVFDEYGQVKYQIASHLLRTAEDRKRQGRRIRHLFERGFFDQPSDGSSRFAMMHMVRGASGGPA